MNQLHSRNHLSLVAATCCRGSTNSRHEELAVGTLQGDWSNADHRWPRHVLTKAPLQVGYPVPEFGLRRVRQLQLSAANFSASGRSTILRYRPRMRTAERALDAGHASSVGPASRQRWSPTPFREGTRFALIEVAAEVASKICAGAGRSQQLSCTRSVEPGVVTNAASSGSSDSRVRRSSTKSSKVPAMSPPGSGAPAVQAPRILENQGVRRDSACSASLR